MQGDKIILNHGNSMATDDLTCELSVVLIIDVNL
jgi:hypothetical protein